MHKLAKARDINAVIFSDGKILLSYLFQNSLIKTVKRNKSESVNLLKSLGKQLFFLRTITYS